MVVTCPSRICYDYVVPIWAVLEYRVATMISNGHAPARHTLKGRMMVSPSILSREEKTWEELGRQIEVSACAHGDSIDSCGE